MRPPNLPTAAADILAGGAIVGAFSQNGVLLPYDLILLVVASILLYAGGVVLNDVFDLKIDTLERPERPIPKGVVSLQTAAILGGSLLLLGVILSFICNNEAGLVALVLTSAILLYDALAKHHSFFGPLVMGGCRGLNLLLGMSLFGLPEGPNWYFILLPIIYIAAVTLISRGEVHGNNKRNIMLSGFLYLMVASAIFIIMLQDLNSFIKVIPFLIVFVFSIFRPLLKAFKINTPENIKKAVKSGVLSLVLMDAALASANSTWWVGLLIIVLLPLSLFLSKRFSVT
ncbi:UbiA-like protein EboC [Flavobacteriaceae bacterium KMM 6897]|nr:UbiA-like protein EboC [Flavobacteriaceae bacterium KMM 6897]